MFLFLHYLLNTLLMIKCIQCRLCCSQPVYGEKNVRWKLENKEIEENVSQSIKWREGERERKREQHLIPVQHICNYVYTIFCCCCCLHFCMSSYDWILFFLSFWGIICCGFSFVCDHFFLWAFGFSSSTYLLLHFLT